MAASKVSKDSSEVLAKATVRVANALEINERELAIILGVDAAVISASIEPESCSGLRALQLIRIYQQLATFTGNDTAAMVHWLKTSNRRFRCSPKERMQSFDGLEEVKLYLDSLT